MHAFFRRWPLYLTFSLIGIILVLGYSAYKLTYLQQERIIRLFNSQQLAMAKFSAMRVENYIDDVGEHVEYLARICSEESFTPKEMRRFLRRANDLHRETSNSPWLDITHLDSDGILRISFADSVLIGEDMSSLPYFDIAKRFNHRGSFVSRPVDILSGALRGEKGVVVVAPIIGTDGFEGLVAVPISVQLLVMEFICPAKATRESTSWVLNSDGIVLAHSNLPELVGLSGDALVARTGYMQLGPMYEDLIMGREGNGEYFFDGKLKYCAYTPVHAGGRRWSLAIATESGAIEELRAGFPYIYILLGLNLLVFAFAGFVALRLNSLTIKAKVEADQGVRDELFDGIIAERDSQLRAVVENSPIPNAIFDKDLKVVWIGEKYQELIQKIRICEAAMLEAGERTCGDRDICQNCELALTLKDGQTRRSIHMNSDKESFDTFTYPVTSGGQIIGVAQMINNVTEKLLLEQELINLKNLS